MSAEHRATAADWGIDPLAPLLQEYATSGRILTGLDDEIRAALRSIAHGELDPAFNAHEEYDRLAALLDEVQPKLAVREARQLGREHGRNAAAQWQRDVLGGQATGDNLALARRVLAGLRDDDDLTALLDALPSPSEEYTATELSADCGWPEPDVEDREAHHRWDTAQFATCEAYATAFTDVMLGSVELACRNELARPFLRPEGSTEPTPPGWIAEPAGVVGSSSDDLVEVVYDPQRHDVMRVPKSRSATALNVLADQGWSQAAGDSTSDLLWRDRVAHTRAALERSAAGSEFEIAGPGRTPPASPGMEVAG